MSDVKVSRQQKAAQTRTRIIDAAYRCFCELGYRATTMDRIATGAGVAVQTLYFSFHTKDELFQAVHNRTVLGQDELPPTRQAWHQAMTDEPDIARAVHHLVRGVVVILARVAPMLPAFHAVTSDPAGEVWRRGERRRLQGYEDLVTLLATKAPIRRGLTRKRAVDLLFVLLSPSTYQALVLDRGWTEREWMSWLERAILRDLFDR